MKEEKSKEPVPPKLPPIPVSTWQPPVSIPVERPGQGANKKVRTHYCDNSLRFFAIEELAIKDVKIL